MSERVKESEQVSEQERISEREIEQAIEREND